RDEPEASLVLHNVFKQAGIALHLQSEPFRISATGREIHVDFRTAGADRPSQRVLCDELLVATGRRPNTSGLGLEGLGIQMDHGAICVDAYGRTSHSNIWAIGDCTGGMQFTHMAESEGRSVLTSLLLPGPFKKKLHRTKDVPRCTFTDPEVGSLGWTEAEAVAQLGAHRIATYQLSFDKLDRAITDGRTEGFIKVVTKKWSSKILGATVVGPAAGELIGELSTAMHCGIPLRKLASVIHAYPTYSLAIRKVADMWLTQTILPSLKKLIGF
ncbi:MAG: FAD-dependent oxidoreductase, partial [Chlamydiia bacterium]|nr:FAD-dependent oxidoreductase [Chlamydiia bacterium]